MRFLFQHVRDSKNVPYTTVAGTVDENGEVLLGWAKCNRGLDKFSKQLGRKIAAGRAEKVALFHPQNTAIVRALENMRERVLRYFRLENYLENFDGPARFGEVIDQEYGSRRKG